MVLRCSHCGLSYYGCVLVLADRSIEFFIYMLVESFSIHTLALLYIAPRITNVYIKDSILLTLTTLGGISYHSLTIKAVSEYDLL